MCSSDRGLLQRGGYHRGENPLCQGASGWDHDLGVDPGCRRPREKFAASHRERLRIVLDRHGNDVTRSQQREGIEQKRPQLLLMALGLTRGYSVKELNINAQIEVYNINQEGITLE